MIEPYVAATVMAIRESAAGIDVFMLRRSSRSAFMPDVFVFPGGRVEHADSDHRALSRLIGAHGAIDPAFVFAAVRETFEECGLLFASAPVDPTTLAGARERVLSGALTFTQMLEDLDLRIDAGALRYFSRWITPPRESRRFDTHFFVARAPAGQAALADAFETHDGLWISPREALNRSRDGTFAIIFPTLKHLERLSAFDSVDALLAFTAAKPIAAVMPEMDAERRVFIPPLLEGVW